MNLMSSRAQELYQRGSELEQMYWNRWPRGSDPSPWESPPPWLGPLGDDIKLEDARQFFRDAAALGSLRAIRALARRSDGEERRHWLREAMKCGDGKAVLDLADDFIHADMLAEAEHWYRYAMDHGRPSAVFNLTMVLVRQDRLDEAEQLIRPHAKGPDGARILAGILAEKGQAEEAARLYEQAESVRIAARPRGGFPDYAVIAAVVITMAVVPFVQAIAARAGDNAYASIRAMVRWLWRRGHGRLHSEHVRRPESRLLVVEDPDPKLRLAIALGRHPGPPAARAARPRHRRGRR